MTTQQDTPRGVEPSKIIFANQLRAVAVLFVLINHLFGIYFLAPDYVSETIHSPILQHHMPREIAWLFSDKFNLGPLGVAIFFLISGFVIPFSFERYSKVQFVIARLFRIYPTYLCALAIEIAVLAISSLEWGQRIRIHLADVVQNIFLIQGFTGVKSIDQVNWSLAIELKFYLAAMLMSSSIKVGRLWPLFVMPGIGLIFNVYWIHQVQNIFTVQLSMEVMYLGFMFIGTLFHYHYKKQVSLPVFWLALISLLLMMLISWRSGFFAEQFFYPVTANYVYALVIFGAAYMFRDRFRPVGIIDWIAGISYPLYLIHAIVGYTLLQTLMGRDDWSFLPSMALTAVVTFGVAQLLHQSVETQSHAWGKSIARVRHVFA